MRQVTGSTPASRLPTERRPRVVYFIHDASDPSVLRRIRMLRLHDIQLRIVGHRRSEAVVAELGGVPVFDLGHTDHGQLAHRLVSLMRWLVRSGKLKAEVRGADTLIARNLEMLLLAHVMRVRYARHARLVYECLDIHPLMGRQGSLPSVVRFLERRMLSRCNILVVSSPGFLRYHFTPRQKYSGDVLVVENKVLESELGASGRQGVDHRRDLRGPTPGAPWRIGWFGLIRDMDSLRVLASVCAQYGPLVEVEIRGIVNPELLDEFEELVAPWSNLNFLGPYDRETDLDAMYAGVHFCWAIDAVSLDHNSRWLLPNRLYESCAFGSIPMTLRSTETAEWCTQHGVGVVHDDLTPEAVGKFLEELTPQTYLGLRRAVLDAEPGLFVELADEEARLSKVICSGG